MQHIGASGLRRILARWRLRVMEHVAYVADLVFVQLRLIDTNYRTSSLRRR